MNGSVLKKLFLIMLMLATVAGTCEAQLFKRNAPKKAERSLFRKNSTKGIKKEPKIREPRKVTKAKREQAKRQEKIEKEYDKAVAEKKKRVVDIQSPEVQERMKQNKKNTETRYKEKKKKESSKTRKGRRKY